jgi:hypothetical protein
MIDAFGGKEQITIPVLNSSGIVAKNHVAPVSLTNAGK